MLCSPFFVGCLLLFQSLLLRLSGAALSVKLLEQNSHFLELYICCRSFPFEAFASNLLWNICNFFENYTLSPLWYPGVLWESSFSSRWSEDLPNSGHSRNRSVLLMCYDAGEMIVLINTKKKELSIGVQLYLGLTVRRELVEMPQTTFGSIAVESAELIGNPLPTRHGAYHRLGS